MSRAVGQSHRQVGEQRSIAIVIVELIQAEQLALEPVVAVHGAVMALGGRHQGVDDGAADFVGQVARAHRIVEVAQVAVVAMVQDQVVEQ